MYKNNISNTTKNHIIIEKEKNNKLKLSKNKNPKNIYSKNIINFNRPYMSKRFKNDDQIYNNKILFHIKTHLNSPNISSFLKSKDLYKNKNSNLKNNCISRSFENRKYKKLKNKTPEISRVSSTRYNKETIIKYQDLYKSNKNKIEKELFYKANKSNKKIDNLKIKFIKKDNRINELNNNSFLYGKKNNKNSDKRKKNNSFEIRMNKKKLNFNIFPNYINRSNISKNNKFNTKDISGISNYNSIITSNNKNIYKTPLENSINNNLSKKENFYTNSINFPTSNHNKTKINKDNNNHYKINPQNKKNSNIYFNNDNYKSNIKINKRFNKKKNDLTNSAIKNNLILDKKLNIKVKFNNKLKSVNNKNKEKNINEKMKQILSKSQEEILKIKEEFVKHFTNKNSPIKNKSVTKINKNVYKNRKNKINKEIQNKNKYLNKNEKINKIYEEKKNKNDSNEKGKLNLKMIKDLKKELLTNNEDKLEIFENSDKQNYYLNESIQLSNKIKEYYKLTKKYPKTDLSFYKYGRLIGQGAFGKVNIGLNVLSGRIVAIKSFDKNKLNSNSENMKKILYESNLMKKLNHPNITKILEIFEDGNYFLIIMEYINGGNLFSFVKKRRKISEKTAKFLFRQIILGIQHMHSKNIVHRDIKLENILIDLNNNIKICDFGISLILKSLSDILYDQCGTPMYMAPEILLSNKNKQIGYIGPPVDIWSAGIALYIMLSGNLPFDISEISRDIKIEKEYNEYANNIILQYCILSKEPKKIDDISDLAHDLLKGILNKNPKKRLTYEQILNHPWLYFDDNYKYHLFTKAEIIMLSKTFIDYRYNKMEDLIETFTLSNLKNDNNKNNKEKIIDNNNSSKSSILTPYNSAIYENSTPLNDTINKNNIIDDEKNNDIKIENSDIIFSNKAKELNMIYELNNNGEIDNGILINSKTNSTRSNKLNNLKENDLIYEDNIKSNNNCYKKNNLVNKKERIEFLLDKIELMGYDKNYSRKIIENNELSQVYALYFLLDNYDKIQ